MKQLVSFEKYEEEGEKYAILDLAAFALRPEEHQEALVELNAEGVDISGIDGDSIRGEIKGRYDVVKKAMNNLSAKGWLWNVAREDE